MAREIKTQKELDEALTHLRKFLQEDPLLKKVKPQVDGHIGDQMCYALAVGIFIGTDLCNNCITNLFEHLESDAVRQRVGLKISEAETQGILLESTMKEICEMLGVGTHHNDKPTN